MSARTLEAWSGKWGLTLATIGSAVGIGSIWKFPYEVGANGGGVFLLFYALGLILIVVPLLLAEFAIGRKGRGDPATSMRAVAHAYGVAPSWSWVGVAGVITGFLILTFYCVIGGWTLGYVAETWFKGLAGTDPHAVQVRYQNFLAAPLQLLGYDVLFLCIATGIVARGVAKGIEAAVKLLMPMLILLMAGLAIYSMVEGDVGATLKFLFTFDWQQLSARAALDALGLGFFSIGVGLGLMITYAAYSGMEISLKEVAIVSVIADSLISLLAGFAVFPIVFAHQLDASSGPGLVFVTLPLAFADMPFGQVTATAFFLLLFVAALASAISMLEIMVASLIRHARIQRPWAALLAGLACALGGIPTILSFNLWSEWFPLAGIATFSDATFFDLIDHLTSNVLLPIGGFAIALFGGWMVPETLLTEQLALTRIGTRILRALLRYVAPAAITITALAPFL